MVCAGEVETIWTPPLPYIDQTLLPTSTRLKGRNYAAERMHMLEAVSKAVAMARKWRVFGTPPGALHGGTSGREPFMGRPATRNSYQPTAFSLRMFLECTCSV